MTYSDGTALVGSRTVHWRFGWIDAPVRGVATATSRDWVRELVDAHGLFRWRGIEQADWRRKPRFAGEPDADFSVSHSGRALLVAVGAGSGIGADVEAAPYAAFASDALVRRMCGPSEKERMLSASPRRRHRELAPLWTAKEATAKALGIGLALDFRTIEIDLPRFPEPAEAVACLAVADESGALVAGLAATRAAAALVAGAPRPARRIPPQTPMPMAPAPRAFVPRESE